MTAVWCVVVVILALLHCTLPCQASSGDLGWPTFRHDNQRTNYAPNYTAPIATRFDSAPIGVYASSLLATDDGVCIGTSSSPVGLLRFDCTTLQDRAFLLQGQDAARIGAALINNTLLAFYDDTYYQHSQQIARLSAESSCRRGHRRRSRYQQQYHCGNH